MSPGVDFLRFTRSATFQTNGTISNYVPIVITDDGIPEDFESFKVVIESIPRSLYTVIEPSTAIVRIADNDGKWTERMEMMSNGIMVMVRMVMV